MLCDLAYFHEASLSNIVSANPTDNKAAQNRIARLAATLAKHKEFVSSFPKPIAI